MGLFPSQDGYVQQLPQEAAQLEAAGYIRCYNNQYTANGRLRQPTVCPFWISPEGQEFVKDKMGGYYTCPMCHQSYDLLHELPWHGADYDEASRNQHADQQEHSWNSGGGTRIGLPMKEQAQIGEDLVTQMGEIPGYGPITWWHPGGALSKSPLDGSTQEWGIEVKTIGYDAIHHRFIPGRPQEKGEKDGMAREMGKKGVLGILVLLDYRRSVADIFVREYPLERGVGAFRSGTGNHLVREVTFKNPLIDPHDPSPQVQSGTTPFAEAQPIPF